jgi:hypothetical protein
MRKQQLHTERMEKPTIRTLLRHMEKAEEPVLNAVLCLMRIKEGKNDEAVALLRSNQEIVPHVLEASWVWSEQYYDLINVLAKALSLEDDPTCKLMKCLMDALKSKDKKAVILALKVFAEATDIFSEELTAIKIPDAIPLIVERLKERGQIKREALLALSSASYSGTDVSPYLREIAHATTIRLNEEGGSEDGAFDRVHGILRSAVEKGDLEKAMDHVQDMLSSKRETDVILALRTIASLVTDGVVNFDDFRVDYNQLFADKRVRVRCETAKLVESLAEKKVVIADAIPHLKNMFLEPRETIHDVCELDQIRASAEAFEQLIKLEPVQELVGKIAVETLLGKENYTAFFGTRILHHEPMYEDVSWVSPEVLNRIIKEMFNSGHSNTSGDILVWIGSKHPEMVAQVQGIVDGHPNNKELAKKMENVFTRIEAAKEEK